MTVLMPLDPTVTPQQAARVLSIRANLLPPEIHDSRRARRTRTIVLFTVGLVILLLGLWYAHASVLKSDADTEYNQTLEQLAAVQQQQQKDENVQKLIKVQNGQTLLKKELKAIEADDLSWANVLDLVKKTADTEEVVITQVSALLDDQAAATTTTSSTTVGTVQITGTAPNKKGVADFVDALSQLESLANPFAKSVTGAADDLKNEKTVNFSLSVSITDKALCGRYSDKTCESKGK
ncbi:MULTISPECIES: PilN domain-containing protein [Actinoplanes]|uniref:PilN domain-containing protein n=1 Tax=Actinoplanes TaxID=1865 RepID=UPI0005F2F610|nr:MULTISPECIES: PilN domain-containing protein [Actinoplanes]GLY01210.1 hypothetical protein Acsp01_15890 [Actinoplanes sp. NBRC 101535]